MTTESKNILKTFSQELANCRHEVPILTILEYLKEGKFGYERIDDSKTIVTNDYVFADNMNTLVMHIRAVVRKPHIFIKKENVIKNVSVASKIDTETTIENYKDPKAWTVDTDEPTPNDIHTFVNEDDFATYENRFVCHLADIAYSLINKKLDELRSKLNTVNKMVNNPENNLIPLNPYVKLSDDNNDLPIVVSNSYAIVKTIGLLIHAKKRLAAVMGSPFYYSCKKAGEFEIGSLYPTNILMGDLDYNYCYKFYLRYVKQDYSVVTDKLAFENYVLINILDTLNAKGFVPDQFAKVIINSSVKARIEKVTFVKEPLQVELSQTEEGYIDVAVTVIPDNDVTKFLFAAADVGLTAEETAQFAKDLREKYQNLDYIDAIVLTANETEKLSNVFYIEPDKYSHKFMFEAVAKVCTYVCEGSEYIHTRNCPICGSSLVAPDGEDFTCIGCKSLYHVFSLGYQDYLYIKRLPYAAVEPEVEPLTIVEDENKNLEVVATPSEETATTEEVKMVAVKRISIRRSFESKLVQGDPKNQDFYTELKNHLLSYKHVNSRISWSCDTFSLGRDKKAKIIVKGKTLCLLLALNPADYIDSKYHVKDMSEKKKFQETPAMVKVKSERGLKFAIELIDIMFSGLELKKNFEPQSYRSRYLSDKTLIKMGLIKINETIVMVPEGQEGTVNSFSTGELTDVDGEEIATTEVVDAPVAAANEVKMVEVKRISIRRSFESKLIQGDPKNQEFYTALKNHLLSFKHVNSRISWSCDSYNLGREKKAKIIVKGKTLCLLLALNPADYIDSKYHVKDMSEKKKFEETPAMVKVKSERGLKFAIELIDIMFSGLELKKNFEPQTYHSRYLSDKTLIKMGLIKVNETTVMVPKGQEGTVNTFPIGELTDVDGEEEVAATKVAPAPAKKPAVAKKPEPAKKAEPVPAIGDLDADEKDAKDTVRKSFEGKMHQAEKEIIEYYGELKNAILSYKKVTSRISWACDSFNAGRDKMAKIAFKGKTLVLFLALNPADYVDDKKFFVKDMSDVKKFEDTPVMVKVKSERGLKRAIELVDTLFANTEKKKDFVPEKYSYPYRSDNKLIEMGLAKKAKSSF